MRYGGFFVMKDFSNFNYNINDNKPCWGQPLVKPEAFHEMYVQSITYINKK